MDNDALANVFAAERVGTIAALTALTSALSKQPGINADTLITDLISRLPEESDDMNHSLLVQWRVVLTQFRKD